MKHYFVKGVQYKDINKNGLECDTIEFSRFTDSDDVLVSTVNYKGVQSVVTIKIKDLKDACDWLKEEE